MLISDEGVFVRNYKPCRVCGVEHQNPRSSSICGVCGPRQAQENLINKERERRMFNPTPLEVLEDEVKALREEVKQLQIMVKLDKL